MPSHSFRKAPTNQCWQGSCCQTVHQEDWVWIEARGTHWVPARAAPSPLDLPSGDGTRVAYEEDISQERKTRTVSPCLPIQPKSEAGPAMSLYCQGGKYLHHVTDGLVHLYSQKMTALRKYPSGASSPCLVKKWWEGSPPALMLHVQLTSRLSSASFCLVLCKKRQSGKFLRCTFN